MRDVLKILKDFNISIFKDTLYATLLFCLKVLSIMKTEVGRNWYQSIHFDELSCR